MTDKETSEVKARLYNTVSRRWDDVIQLAVDEVFLSKEFVTELGLQLIELKKVTLKGRRFVPNFQTDEFWKREGLKVVDGKGKEVVLHPEIITEAFGEDESFRYLSDLAHRAYVPMRRRPNKKMLLRYQLLSLAFYLAGTPVKVWIRDLYGK